MLFLRQQRERRSGAQKEAQIWAKWAGIGKRGEWASNHTSRSSFLFPHTSDAQRGESSLSPLPLALPPFLPSAAAALFRSQQHLGTTDRGCDANFWGFPFFLLFLFPVSCGNHRKKNLWGLRWGEVSKHNF